jgi:hypothetical protein
MEPEETSKQTWKIDWQTALSNVLHRYTPVSSVWALSSRARRPWIRDFAGSYAESNGMTKWLTATANQKWENPRRAEDMNATSNVDTPLFDKFCDHDQMTGLHHTTVFVSLFAIPRRWVLQYLFHNCMAAWLKRITDSSVRKWEMFIGISRRYRAKMHEAGFPPPFSDIFRNKAGPNMEYLHSVR